MKISIIKLCKIIFLKTEEGSNCHQFSSNLNKEQHEKPINKSATNK
jgi:hypothetical protein